MKRTILVAIAALSASAAVLPSAALAQTSDNWQFQGTLYGYFPTIGGTTRFPARTGGSDVSVDAETILKDLKFVFMGSLEARKGRWGAFTDVLYMDLGNSKSGFRDFSVDGRPIPVDASASADFDLKGWVWTLAGTYRVVSDPGVSMDVLAGARLLDVTQKMSWNLSGNIGSIPVQGRAGDVEASLSDWDAIIGVKGRVAFGADRKWFVPYYLDVGTGESDLTWQAMTGLGYTFSWGDVLGAWRYLDYNMKSGKAIESLNFNGPMIAFVFRW